MLAGDDLWLCYLPLIEERPDVDDEDHDHEDDPTSKRAHAPTQKFLIEEETHRERSDDLSYPIDNIIKRSRTDVEQGAVVVVELYMQKMISFRNNKEIGMEMYAMCRTSSKRRT